MVTIADVMAAKLLVQLRDAGADVVAAALVALDAAPPGGGDLVARLEAAGTLDRRAAARARRWVALYEQTRVEGLYLQHLERRGVLPKAEAHALLAAQEASAERQRLGALLVARGRLTSDEDRAILERITEGLVRDDARVVARYRAEGFAGAARPLIPGVEIRGPEAFRVAAVFRSPTTQRLVRAEVDRLRALGLEAAPVGPGPDLGEVTVELATAPGADEDTAKLDAAADPGTSRFRAAPAPAPGEVGAALRARRTIGPYEVVECLGQGGMGAVYLARDPEAAGALVAVKVLQADRAGAEDVARFRREAALLARVRHPAVVHLIDQATTDDGLDLLVLPAYPGRSLRAALRERGGRLPQAEALDVVALLCGALEAVHAAGVVHRDVKPENIFLVAGQGLDLRLLDFGIARLADGVPPGGAPEAAFRTVSGVVSGSPAYVAPEVALGDPVDGRADLYAVGVLLFELLAGRTPFVAATPYDLLRAHVLEVPPTLAAVRRDVAWAPALEALVAGLLAKEPDRRPRDAVAVRQALAGRRRWT